MENKRVRTSGKTKWGGAGGVQASLLQTGQWIGHPSVRLALTLLIQFFAALLLAQGRFLGYFAPFGVAFVAAAAAYPSYEKHLRRLMPSMALTGAILGYFIAAGSVDGMKYAAASILCFAAGLIFRGTAFPRRLWFTPVVAGGSLVLTNAVYLMAAEPGFRDILLFACEAGISACAAFFYIPAVGALSDAKARKRERPPNSAGSAVRGMVSQRTAIIAAGLSLVIVLADFTPFAGMSVGRMAGLFMTLSITAAAGPLYGCATGLLSGLALDLAASGAPSVAFVYAAAGLFSGAFRKHGAFWAALCFTVAHAALMPWAWPDAPLSVLYECFAIGVIWFLANRVLSEHARELIAMPSAVVTRGESSLRGEDSRALQKLQALRDAFDTVGYSVRRRTREPQREIPVSSYDIAVERVCRNCRINNLCWSRDYASTKEALDSAAEKIKYRGRAHTQDFPPFFTARCENLGDFVANINESIALRESRSQYRKRAADDIRMLGAQYDAMNQVLTEISEDLSAHELGAEQETREFRRALASRGIAVNADVVRTGQDYACRLFTSVDMPRGMLEDIEDIASAITRRNMRAAPPEEEKITLREMETLRGTVGVGLKQRRGEDESGDSAAYFRTEDGRLYMIIADGMGSGPDAARESASFVRMMEGFLKAGVSVAGALQLLSPALAIKCGGETFTTCDVLCVDLRNGEGESYKCGAAPTYVCAASGKEVRRISGNAIPVGLPSDAPEADHTRLSFEVGDVVVMVSDGLADQESDAWLVQLLTDHRFTSAANLASNILDAAAQRTGSRDDMTVLVLKLSAMR